MTVKVTKPAVNLREKLAEVDKPSGIAGEAMLRAETPQEQFNLIGAGRKNFLINGDFQVSQRGDFTSLASVSGNGYSRVDRWYVNAAGGVSYQHKIDQTLPNGSVTNTVYQVQTGTGYTALGQRVEDLKPLLGKTVTFSFWAKSNINAGFSYYDGTSQPFGIYLIPDNTWRYYTWTTTLPSTMTELRPEIWSNAADRPAGSYYEVAQMQLELGSVATPFEHRSYGEELALCQRYYQIHYPLGSGVQNSATAALVMVHLPVPMRVFPTLGTRLGDYSNINVEHDDTYDVTSITLSHGIDGSGLDELSTFIANVNTSGSNTVGYGVCVMCDRNGDWFTFDAEL